MNKPELISEIAKGAALSKRQAEKALWTLTQAIRKTLQGGKKVTISGFGTFDVGKRIARSGVNPRTGARIQIPAMKVPRFRAGKNLKAALR